jgi:hypothetical protein
MQVEKVIPLLRIFDVKKAKAFYLEYLSFTLDWEHRFEPGMPLYMQVSRGGLSLHLTEHHGDCTPGSAVFVWMQGLAAFHRELHSRNYPYLRPGLEQASWGAQLMTVLDPFGNKILFNERTTE